MPYNHASRIQSYMGYVKKLDTDITLVSIDGVHIGIHKIVLRLFSSVLSEIVTQQEPISHISVPASGTVLNHLVNTLTTGVAVTNNKEELNKVVEVANLLGLGFINWQIGLGRKTKKNEVLKKEPAGEILDSPSDAENTVDVEYETIAADIVNEKKTFDCEKCDEKFTLMNSYKKHLKVVHGFLLEQKEGVNATRERVKCYECDKTFTTKKYRNRHVRKDHQTDVNVKKEEKEAPCSECMKIHKFNLKDDKHFACDMCNTKFYGMKGLQKHNNRSHNIPSRIVKTVDAYDPENLNHCHKCKEALKSKTDLIYHEDTKHVEENTEYINCRFCGRKIKRLQKGFFREHIRTHTGEREEVCSYCGTAFKHKKALKNHERLHTGEKPYKCEFCFVSFTQRTGLVSHQKSMSGCKVGNV